jgi:hypothetical protein
VVARGFRSVPLLLPLLSLPALAGCRDALSQVVVVLQSDLVVPTDADGIQTVVVAGPVAPSPSDFGAFFGSGQLTSSFPLSFGVNSGGDTSSFSFTVQLMHGFFTGQPLIVVNRSVTDVRFVEEQTMMLVIPLLRACACEGTSCPSPGNPMCDAIDRPTLVPFDPAVAPPSTMGANGSINISPPVRQLEADPVSGGEAS